MTNSISLIVILLISLLFFMFISWLIVKSLLKYLKTPEHKSKEKSMLLSLGENIKKCRIDNKMTQEFVAERLQVSRQSVSKWETGVSDPSTANLIALASLFNTSVETLLNIE